MTPDRVNERPAVGPMRLEGRFLHTEGTPSVAPDGHHDVNLLGSVNGTGAVRHTFLARSCSGRVFTGWM